jgi:hypothetical protein
LLIQNLQAGLVTANRHISASCSAGLPWFARTFTSLIEKKGELVYSAVLRARDFDLDDFLVDFDLDLLAGFLLLDVRELLRLDSPLLRELLLLLVRLRGLGAAAAAAAPHAICLSSAS